MKCLYHGTDIDSAREICGAGGIDVTRGSKHSDFGQGFYTTDDYRRAVKWAKHKASIRGKRAAVVTLMVDLDLAKKDIEIFEDDLRWGRFIINNRNGIAYINKVSFKENNLDAKYPITSSEMLYSINGIYNSNYSMQYAFHTADSIKYILKMTYKQV